MAVNSAFGKKSVLPAPRDSRVPISATEPDRYRWTIRHP